MRHRLLLTLVLFLPMVASAQNKKSEPLFEQAAERAAVGQYEEAVKLLNKAIDIDPAYAEAYLLLGRQQMALQQYGEAQHSFLRCLDLNPRMEQFRSEAKEGLATAQWRQHAVEHPEPF